MKTLTLSIGNRSKEIYVDEAAGIVYTKISCPLCINKVRKFASIYIKNPEIGKLNDDIYLVIKNYELTRDGEILLKSLQQQPTAYALPVAIPILLLAVVLGISTLCVTFPDNPLCSGLVNIGHTMIWYIILPLLSFTMAFMVGTVIGRGAVTESVVEAARKVKTLAIE